MNKELELHDSTLKEIKLDGTAITLYLDKAIVHHSEGTPGVDKGTCWVQRIDILLKNALIIKKPDDIPNDIDYGHFIIDNKKYDNMIKTNFQASTEIEVVFITMYGNKLKIKAKHIIISEVGEPEYLQEFS